MIKYGFAHKATYALKAAYAYKVRLLCVKRLMLEGLSCSFRRGDDSPSDLKCFFTLWWPLDWVFDDSLIVLIRRPGGSVPVVRCSVFLQGSWFPIGSSWFVVPEDLSQWCNVPSFCKDLDFRLGPPDSSSRKICPSVSMFHIFARILISDWVVLTCRPERSVPLIWCSVFLRVSWFPFGSSLFSNAIVRLVPRWSGLQTFYCAYDYKQRPSLFNYYLHYPVG